MQVRTLRTIVAGRPAITTARTSTLVEAARLMKERNIGSLLVLEGSRLAGIFTERDALFRVLAAARDPASDLYVALRIARVASRRVLMVVGGEWSSSSRALDRFFAALSALADELLFGRLTLGRVDHSLLCESRAASGERGDCHGGDDSTMTGVHVRFRDSGSHGRELTAFAPARS